jgi:enterochelin esterase-like enzyme
MIRSGLCAAFLFVVLQVLACGGPAARHSTDAGPNFPDAAGAAGSSGAAGSATLDAGSGGAAGSATLDAGQTKDAAQDEHDSGALDASMPDAGIDSGVSDPGTTGDGDFMIGPNPAPHPDVATKNVPHGRTFSFKLDSTRSAIFPGTTTTLLPQNVHAFMRDVGVYIPKQYVDGTKAPFVVVQDARDQNELRNTIDNLIVDKRLPILIALFVNSGGGDSKGSERGLEYDTMSDAYSRFVDTEVLPAAKHDSAIKAAYPLLAFTDNPEGRSTYGCSSGGSAAFTQGWFTPNAYRRIVTYSATLVDQQDDDAPEETQFPLGGWEYHSGLKLIASNAMKPLRVFLEVGEHDNGYGDPESTHHNWVMANQRTAAALKAAGYHYRFVFVKGAGHCDAAAVRATLPETLQWMWAGYPR